MNLCRRTLLSAAALMPVAGCVAAQQWRPTSTTAEPQTLAILDGGLLLGSSGPALTGPSGPIPVTATTGYGREARWVSLATAQQRILGIGATHGGAHANARWAVFAGTTAGIDEQEQTFDVFHGWGAGTLVAAAFVGTAPVLVGSWQSEAAGLDIAVWLLHGSTWTRQRSTGTELASSTTSMVQAADACGGDRLMIAGQAIDLNPLRARPVAWTSTDPRAGWLRVDLPCDAASATAQSVAAHPDGWLVTGRSDAALAAWTIGTDLTAKPLDLPSLPGDGPTHAAAAPDGTLLITAGDGTTVQVLTGRDGSWQRSSVGAGAPLAAAWAQRAHLIVGAEGRTPRLFELS